MHRLIFIGAVMTCASTALGTSIVYNNTITPVGGPHPLLPGGETNSPEHGSQVMLGGYERIATNITIKMRIRGGGAATFKNRVRFYRNDGPGGKPGTMFWDSGNVNAVIDSGVDLPYSFSVPSVRVPDSFTYSLQISDRQIYMAAAIGPALYNPPSIGSAPFGYWSNSGGAVADWNFINSGEPPWSARIDANPIPGDVDHNARVNIDDLVAVITAWGTCANCPASPCPADVTSDCQVNIDDLVGVIINWG